MKAPYETIIEISKKIKIIQEIHKTKISRKNLQTDEIIKKFDLTEKELICFSIIFFQIFSNSSSVSLLDLKELYEMDDKEYLHFWNMIKVLCRKDLLVIDEKYSRRKMMNPNIQIDENVFSYLITGKDLFSGCDFSDFMSVLGLASKLFEQKDLETISEKNLNNGISKLIRLTDDSLNISKLLKPFIIDEQLLILYAIVKFVSGRGTFYLSKFSELVYEELYQKFSFLQFVMNKNCKPIEMGLIKIEEGNRFVSDPELSLSEKTVKKLFNNDVFGFCNKKIEFETVRCVMQSSKRDLLFFNDTNNTKIEDIYTMLKKNTFKKIQKNIQKTFGSQGINMIFHGPPGTGKTAIAYKLAQETKRKLLQVDISTIQSCWVGESEKNTRKIFDEYRKSVKVFKHHPILLFNEADALISNRISVRDSVDKMNNAMQNILLEELENFEGILIATSNLVDNMDSAFSRRFLFKILFDLPDAECRYKIWKSKLKGLKKSIYKKLAKEKLSGGQIDNVVRKWKMYDIIGKNPDVGILFDMCHDEKIGIDDKSTIGF